ncbi:MAG: response regulator transcription factor [Anaerolineae bacterium]|jgi:NarL family two-component system response regulator LiaR
MTDPIGVLIVDDHLMVRDGLKVFLSTYDDLEVVGDAQDGEQAIQLCAQLQPDVVLMDILMPNMDGPTAIALIRERFPQIQIIALTSFVEEKLVQDALQAGAIGYLLKDIRANELAEAIRNAYRGRTTMDLAATQVLIQATRQPPPLGYDLTDREREVLTLLVSGMTNKEIAAELTVSMGTVRLHVSNILSKLGASNRTEATSLALQHNLVD